MLISGILIIASPPFYSTEKIFMIFNGILTFNGPTGKCCPIKVNLFIWNENMSCSRHSNWTLHWLQQETGI